MDYEHLCYVDVSLLLYAPPSNPPHEQTPELPELPKNARYIYHENDCYDWGTIGWAINEHGVSVSGYKYFIFMNSSVRGPFVAPYARKFTSWQRLLTDRLSDRVKVVGPTISCEGSPPGGRVTEVWRVNPHVQSYVLATDQVRSVWIGEFCCGVDQGIVADCRARIRPFP